MTLATLSSPTSYPCVVMVTESLPQAKESPTV